jgi:hypothetical protein
LIEDIYRSIGKSVFLWKMNPRLMFIVAYMFPETANWLASADEYVPLSHSTLFVY